MSDSPIVVSVAVLGGTGKEGRGLAYRWARAGYHVLIGSRDPDRARATAQDLLKLLHGTALLEGSSNLDAAAQAEIVVLTVPYAAHRETLESVREALKGKLLIDVTVPVVPPKVTVVHMPPAGSAAQEAQQILGPEAQVAAAFQNISHEHLLQDEDVECDVLVTDTDKRARAEALKLVAAAGLTGWDAGAIENSMVIEGLTSILIHMNRQYGSRRAGIRITGVHRT